MVTVTYDELEVNATLASHDLRLTSLRASLRNILRHPPSADRDFTVDVIAQAISHTEAARSKLATTLPDVEYDADMTILRLDWNEVEFQPAYRDRADEYQTRGA